MIGDVGSWQIITGEYPPQMGGLSGFSAKLARELAASVEEPVHVWAPVPAQSSGLDICVHELHEGWNPRSLEATSRALDETPSPRVLLVQYAPNAWGERGVNRAFAKWLRQRAEQGDRVRPFLHELWYYPRLWDRPTRWLLPIVQRQMIRDVIRASEVIDVAIPEWERQITALQTKPPRRVFWAPVPSNIDVHADPNIDQLRRQVAANDEVIIGSFGTFSDKIAALLERAIVPVLKECAKSTVLLIGNGSTAFLERLAARVPTIKARLRATGAILEADVSRYLQICDVMVQPYPDGVSTRRGSVMAALAHAKAVVTTTGSMTESVWAESSAVELVRESRVDRAVDLVRLLHDDETRRSELGARAKRLYDERFAIENYVRSLLAFELSARH